MTRDICGFNTYLNVVPGINRSNVTSGGGVLTLTHAASPDSRVKLLVNLISSKSIVAVLTKNWSREDTTNDNNGDTRTALLARIQSIPDVKLILQTKKISTTKFKFEFTDDTSPTPMTPVSGATEYDYAHANKRHWRVITDGTDWILEVDDGAGYVEEIRTADTRKIRTGVNNFIVLTSEGSADATKSTKSEGSVVVAYDSSSDKPSAENAFAQKSLNGESAVSGYQDYTAGLPSDDPPGHPEEEHVDDWEGGVSADGNTTMDHMPAAAGVTKKQAYTIDDYTIVNDQQAVKVVVNHAASVGAKLATGTPFIFDGTTQLLGSGAIPITSFSASPALFRTAPDGGVWTQPDFDNLEIGHQTITDVTFDPEKIILSAILMEVVDIKNDAPAVAAAPLQVILY